MRQMVAYRLRQAAESLKKSFRLETEGEYSTNKAPAVSSAEDTTRKEEDYSPPPPPKIRAPRREKHNKSLERGNLREYMREYREENGSGYVPKPKLSKSATNKGK